MKPSPHRIAIPRIAHNRPRGFTLVELLVVITIIIVLAAVVLTLTQKVKAKALQANTLSSLRQVAAFSVAYSTENNGDINTYRWPTDKYEGNPSWFKNTFWGRMQPYLFPEAATAKEIKYGFEALFKTDTSKGTYKGTAFNGPHTFADESGIAIPFSFNLELYPFNQWKKTSSIRDQSQVIYAVIGQAHFKQTHGETYVPMATGGAKNSNPIYFMPDKKILASFVDGHVETLSAPLPERNIK